MHDETFISNLWKDTLQAAIARRASDVHVEPGESSTLIRFRIDGTLFAYFQIDQRWHHQLISHIKILANLDIGEKRLPQDGRYQFMDHQTNGASPNLPFIKIDCRVSTIPTIRGEKVVLRLLKQSTKQPSLSELNFSSTQLEQLISALDSPQGLILITGPTGSGKTMTLFSCLDYLNNGEKNISTVEDPVEIELPGIQQICIQPKSGLDYVCALRALLRQDPDVIMIGEIRDSETAQIALHASQTGHLVLASLHTNSTVSTIQRLLHLGCERDVLASCLHLINAQRLIRTFCVHCHGEEKAIATCKKCLGVGFCGRQAIHEMLPLNKALRQMILENKSEQALFTFSQQNGMQPLRERALELVSLNLTSLSEVNQQIGGLS